MQQGQRSYIGCSRSIETDEIIISGQRDKRGRRFGFTRFLDIDDVIKLVLKLDNLFKTIESYLQIYQDSQDQTNSKTGLR